MANYNAVSRTNYFKVTDEDKYQELFGKLQEFNDLYDFTETDEEGNTVHGFGTYDATFFDDEVPRDDVDDDSPAFDFIKELQKILPDGEAFIYLESGYEKLRYVTGFALIATNKDCRCFDFADKAIETAQEMLNNPDWDTKTIY